MKEIYWMINEWYRIMSGKYTLLLGLFLGTTCCLAQNEVRVSDFGAIPNDGLCDIKAIKKALKEVKRKGATTLVFDAGVFDLDVKDAEKNIAIEIEGIPNLEVRGAVNEKGEPSTILLRHYEMKPNIKGLQILSVSECPHFTLKNMRFDNSPQYLTAGEVVKNDGKSIEIKIFQGNPMIDNTVLYCCNLWNLKTRDLKHVGSVTFGGDVDKKLEEYTAHIIGDPTNRTVCINSPRIASLAKTGDGISWNFGWNGIQVNFTFCDDLKVENVWTHSAIGFCMEASYCHNIHTKGVRFQRTGSQLHVGSRDAWKLYCCTGEVIMNDMYCEGVRWDGQNVSGLFLWVDAIEDKNHLIMKRPWGNVPKNMKKGDLIGFMKDRKEEVLIKIKSVQRFLTKDHLWMYRVGTEEPIPAFVNAQTICNMYSWNVDSYQLVNSTFKNIAGTASLIRNDNVLISGCKFYNIMYPAVCIGGALEECEGVISKHIKVTGCEFVSSGWQARHGAYGGVAVRVQRRRGLAETKIPLVKDVSISNNIFRNCNIGIQAEGVDGLMISKNTFLDVNRNIVGKDNVNVVVEDNIVPTGNNTSNNQKGM